MKRRIFGLAFVFTVGLLLATQALEAQPEEKGKTAEKSKTTLTLTIDFGDGAQKRFPAIPCKTPMTVSDALDWADDHPHGIDIKYRGKGETTLLTQIDDLKNDDKNWIYRVNGKLGDRSYGVFPVKPGDAILWSFEKYQ